MAQSIEVNKPIQEKIFTREFLLMAFGSFLVSNNFYALLTVVPLYSLRVLNLSEAEAGLAAGLFVAGMLCSRFAAGKLTERLGFKVMLAANAAFLIFFTLLYSQIETAAGLYVLRIANGFFYGLLNNTFVTIASSIIPKERTGEGIGYYTMIHMAAWATGPYISIYFANRGEYDLLFLFCAILPAIVLASYPFIRFNRIKEKIKQNEAPSVADSPGDEVEQTIKTGKTHFLDNVLEVSVFPVALVCVFILMFTTSVTSFIAPYAETIGLADSASVFFIFYVIGLIGTRPFISKLFDKKGATFVLIPGIIIYIIAFICLATVHSYFSFMLAAFLIGTGLGTCQNTTLSLSLSIAPRKRLGFASATFYAAYDTCAAIGPLIAGLLIPVMGYRYMFIVSAVWIAIGLPVYLLVSRKFINKQPAKTLVSLD